MTDRELLEMASKAAGHVPHHSYREKTNSLLWISESGFPSTWSPLTDDGDALRLAVMLNIVVWECVQYDRAMAEVRYGKARGEYWEPIENGDPYTATRRAIVRAAAEIGKTHD
jgi:hypothetical protein